MTSIEENELLYRKWVNDIWNLGNERTIDELLERNGTIYYPHVIDGEEKINGPEEFKKFVRGVRSRYENFRADVEDLVVNGSKVIAICRVSAVFRDSDGSCTDFNTKSLCSIIFRNGKIAEIWNNVEIDSNLRDPEVFKLQKQKADSAG